MYACMYVCGMYCMRARMYGMYVCRLRMCARYVSCMMCMYVLGWGFSFVCFVCLYVCNVCVRGIHACVCR